MRTFRKIICVLGLVCVLWTVSGVGVFADVVVNILVVNGTDTQQEKDVYQDLPKELKAEDILDSAGLKVDFDVTKGQYAVSGKVTLAPKSSKTFRVKVKDVWQIRPEEVATIQKQIETNFDLVKGTKYEDTAKLKRASLEKRLNFIVDEQKKAQDSAGARIDRYREYAAELGTIRNDAVSVKYWRSELPKPIPENIFKLVLEAQNPSKEQAVTQEQRYYLPEEVKPEHILDYEGFEIKYDASRGQSYLSRTEKLDPGEVKRYEVGILDIWRINQSKLDDLKNRTATTYKLLEPTKYAASAKFLASEVKKDLAQIESSQGKDTDINKHIRAFRENEKLFKQAKTDVESLEELLQAVREKLVRSRMQNVLRRIKGLRGVADVADAMMAKQPTQDKAWIYILVIMGFVGVLTVIAFIIWGRRSRDVKIEDTEENKAAKEEAGLKP